MQQVVVSQQTGYARNASESAYPNLWSGLVGWWLPSVNPRGGNRLFDLSPFRNHGTLTNMTNDDWVVSQGQGALDFDGVNDYVDTNSFARLGTLINVSLSAWVYMRNAAGTIVAKYNSPQGFALFSGAGPVVSFDGRESGAAYLSSGGASYSLNQWVHVCGTKRGNLWSVYVNGRLGNSATQGNGALSVNNTSANLLLGQYSFFDFAGDCQLDDVRFYNRALTPPEIRLLSSKRGIGLQPTRPRRIPEEIAGAGVANPVLFYNHYTNQGFF